MTPNQLERATDAFRRGYRNARDGKPSAASDYVAGSFAREDYESGWKAARNEIEADHARRVCRVADALSRR